MMLVDVRTLKNTLGQAEVVNQAFRYKNGETLYAVKWRGPHGEVFTFEVRHDRMKGAWALAEKVCRKVRKEMEKFYSLSDDKVVNGLVRQSDIPKIWHKDFGKWLGVATVSMLPRLPCPAGCLDADFDKPGELAYNASDVYGFLDAMLYGKCKVFD